VKRPFIALITDFGEDDYFVASLKGVILRINPGARIIDVTHQVPSFDIRQGSFTLFSCYKYFPPRTIFLVIIDPGVGSSRPILLVKTKKYFFVAPDNGVLSLTLKSEEVEQIIKITNKKFFLEKQSKTFEGRDKMAPVAAWLSKGTSPLLFGPPVQDYKALDKLEPIRKEREIIGSIIYADKFGNLITNIPRTMVNKLKKEAGKSKLTLLTKNKKISSFRESYSQGRRGELFYLVGSLGFIEIATREASASRKIKAKVSDTVKIVIRSPREKVIAKEK
jgi:S-adenosylmethionine hydrolase